MYSTGRVVYAYASESQGCDGYSDTITKRAYSKATDSINSALQARGASEISLERKPRGDSYGRREAGEDEAGRWWQRNCLEEDRSGAR